MAAKSAATFPISLKRTPFLGFRAIQPNTTPPFLIPLSTFHSQNQSILTLYHKMLQKPSVFDYGTLLNDILKRKHYSEVVILFKKMSLHIDEYTRNIVITCYCRLKQVDSGFATLATFLKRGYAPDTVSMNCLIKGLFFEEKVVEAVELFRKVVREKLCEVNEITTSTVLDGLCKSGNVVNAVQLLRDLENVNAKLNSFGYTAVIDGLCKSGMVDDAMTLFSRMIDRGVVPSVVTYKTLIQGLCDFRRLDQAKKLLERMIGEEVYPDLRTFTTLVDAYCKEGLIKDAEDVVEIMKRWDVKPNVVTYNALMNGYCWQGQFDKANEVLNLMINEGLKPNVVSYTAIIKGYCREGLFEQGEEMLEKMEQSGCFPDSVFHRSITECCLKHRVDSTNFLKRIVERDVTLDPRTSAFATIQSDRVDRWPE